MTREEQIKMEFAVAEQKYNTAMSNLRAEQAACSHQWSETKYDPEYVKEPITELRWQGVDCFPAYTGQYRTIKKDRWSRQCKCCEKVEYTYEQAPVAYAPKFG